MVWVGVAPACCLRDLELCRQPPTPQHRRPSPAAAAGRMGLQGNLTAAQVVEQVVAARRLLWEEDLAAGAPRHITPIT